MLFWDHTFMNCMARRRNYKSREDYIHSDNVIHANYIGPSRAQRGIMTTERFICLT